MPGPIRSTGSYLEIPQLMFRREIDKRFANVLRNLPSRTKLRLNSNMLTLLEVEGISYMNIEKPLGGIREVSVTDTSNLICDT